MPSYTEEAQVDADAEVTMDTVEEAIAEDDDFEEEETYLDAIQAANASEEPVKHVDECFSYHRKMIQPAVLKSKVDPADWKLEVERVTPMLKVQLTSDNRDWRVHLEQMVVHQKV